MQRISVKSLVALAMVFGASCANAKEVKVGFFCPLSGAVAVYGNESLKAAQFALDEMSQKRLLGANTIKLIPADTAGVPAQAAQAVQRMIDADEVMAVFGGCTSPETAAAIEITEPAKIPLLSHLAQDSSLTQKGNKWFVRISQTAKVFSSNAAEWAISKQKAKSVYILARNDNYGQSLADAFEAKTKELGATISGRVAYEPNGKEFKPILARMAEAKPDFVSILGFYTDTGLIVKQMAELQIKLPIFANTAPAISQFRDIAGPASDGAYGALYYYAGSIDTAEGKSFLKNWQDKFGRAPTQYEAMGYDGLYVLAEAIKRADAAGKLTPEGIRAIHVPTYEAALEKIRRRVAKAKPGEILWFLGLDPQLHVGMEEPSRDLLDELGPNNPILVQTINFHGLFINTLALKAFEIDAHYKPPLGGRVVNGSDGLPWKFAETATWQLCNRFYEMCGEQRNLHSFEDWISKFVEAGYTTTSEIMIEPGVAPMLQAAIKSRPNPLRIIGYESKHLGGEVSVPLDFGDDDFRMIGTKLHGDGSVLLGNIWTTNPYLNNKMTLQGMGLPQNSTGHANLTPEKMYELVSKYVREGWQMSVHAHGDRTIDMALDVYERVIGEVPDLRGPLRIEHCGLMREDQIDRAIRLNVVCSYFLPYIYNWGEALRDFLLGEEAAARFVPSGSATRKGMRVSYHCDSPMTWPDALVCLHVAVTRRTMKGAVIGPEQRVSMEDALKAVTIDAAFQLRMEDKIGSIAVGKYADFVILGANPTTCDPERILEIPIVRTVVGGRDIARKQRS